jgi:hypothetical protein
VHRPAQCVAQFIGDAIGQQAEADGEQRHQHERGGKVAAAGLHAALRRHAARASGAAGMALDSGI